MQILRIVLKKDHMIFERSLLIHLIIYYFIKSNTRFLNSPCEKQDPPQALSIFIDDKLDNKNKKKTVEVNLGGKICLGINYWKYNYVILYVLLHPDIHKYTTCKRCMDEYVEYHYVLFRLFIY